MNPTKYYGLYKKHLRVGDKVKLRVDDPEYNFWKDKTFYVINWKQKDNNQYAIEADLIVEVEADHNEHKKRIWFDFDKLLPEHIEQDKPVIERNELYKSW